MYSSNLTSPDYEKIKRFLSSRLIKLLIVDFNGVLDDYVYQKNAFLTDLLGENAHFLPELLLSIERAYMANRTVTIEQSFERFLKMQGIVISDEQRVRLTNHMFESHLTEEARDFLDSLEIPFVIYTALTRERAERALGGAQYALFTRDQYREEKPSIINLQTIMHQYGVLSYETCVVGDGLIDDLLPASLIGAHTILVSPHADVLIHPTEV